ncbi:MAG: dephospho-CoA kinase [Anaerolineales bacterium]|jgi:dephospho-CoA kinase
MSAWPDKFVIGLTGNIATGKSIVRRMLEHLGAYGIDADALGHRAMAVYAPGFKPVVETFGKWILDSDGQIDRRKLAHVVFSDPDALASLEAIIHPLVGQAIDFLLKRATHKIVVIEAIKLLEAKLHERCDSVWVAHAAPETQLARLVRTRKISAVDAQQRMRSQPPQQEKLDSADVVIYNTGSFEDTWKQVLSAWQEVVLDKVVIAERPEAAVEGEFFVMRAGPDQADEIAAFITEITKGSRDLERQDVMAAFGEKAFLLLKKDDQIIGLLGWQVENLVSRVDEIYLRPDIPLQASVNLLAGEMERASKELLCEAALLFLPPKLARHQAIWGALDYEPKSVEDLSVRIWREAANESMPSGSVMFFKRLRADRVLRPV